ncbi:hypothetical protein Tco_0979855 [Tanacetum coccineum]
MRMKRESLVSATPLSTAFFSTSIVQDFQDSTNDEEDTRSTQEYLNDLEEEYQARALIAKSKRFFKKGRFQPERLAQDLEVSSIWRIQGIRYGILEFLGVATMLDIF